MPFGRSVLADFRMLLDDFLSSGLAVKNERHSARLTMLFEVTGAISLLFVIFFSEYLIVDVFFRCFWVVFSLPVGAIAYGLFSSQDDSGYFLGLMCQ